MNLWFRLIWMLLTVRWRSRAGVLDTTSLRMTVLPNDLDLNGHVNNGRYLTLADLARIDFVLRSGAARVALALRARPIVGDATAKFRRDLRPFQRYAIETRMLGWDEKWTFLEHRFVRQGRVLGVVVVRGLLVAPGGPVTSAALATAMQIGPASPPLPGWVLNWHLSCDRLSDTLRAEEVVAGTSNREARSDALQRHSEAVGQVADGAIVPGEHQSFRPLRNSVQEDHGPAIRRKKRTAMGRKLPGPAGAAPRPRTIGNNPPGADVGNAYGATEQLSENMALSTPIELPFTRESVTRVLTFGAHPETSPYSHKQIAEWCDRFWCQYLDVDAAPAIEKLLPVLTDVETQWDLYLANSYSLEELRSRSFDDEKMPVQWFHEWLIEIDK